MKSIEILLQTIFIILIKKDNAILTCYECCNMNLSICVQWVCRSVGCCCYVFEHIYVEMALGAAACVPGEATHEYYKVDRRITLQMAPAAIVNSFRNRTLRTNINCRRATNGTRRDGRVGVVLCSVMLWRTVLVSITQRWQFIIR